MLQYTKASREFISPGLMMLEEVSNANSDLRERQRRVGRVDSWVKDSVARLKQIAADAHKRTAEDMSQRLEEAKEPVKQIHPTDSQAIAIRAGVEVMSNAVNDALVENAAAKPLNRLIKL